MSSSESVFSQAKGMIESSISCALEKFQNERFGTVRIVMRNNDPWFVAKDVAACIEYDPSSINKMCSLCRDKDRIVVNGKEYSESLSEYSENRGNPNLTLISESGLYRILAKCNLPKCEPFESWVFDEVLPSIRKAGVYATDDFIKKSIDNPDWAIAMLQQVKFERQQKELALRQRDEAVRTKYFFVEGRDAKMCGMVGGLTNANERLREQIGDAKNWKCVKAIKWLKDYFLLSQGLYIAVANKLKEICKSMNLERREIESSEHGTVKIYPQAAIDILHERVKNDQNMLSKYRPERTA